MDSIIKNKFENIKSNFFLRILFTHLQKIKFLKIIKYNKNIQKKVSLSIKDYKEYSEIYTPIEIELTPTIGEYCNFIHYPKETEESQHYHIYFIYSSGNKKESNKFYLSKFHKVAKINIIIDYQIKSFENLFSYSKGIVSINFKKFYRKNITNMKSMFSCESLKEINLSNFNTDNVTNMSGMFYGCSSLEKINLSNFNTENVINMNNMFYGCSSLKEINLSNFNTNKIKYIRSMFEGCSSLKKINLSNFNIENVEDISYLFSRCTSLKEIDLSNINTKNVTNMSKMFYKCSSLKEIINLSNFIINSNIEMKRMFSGCSEELKIKVKAQIKNISDEAFL